MQVLRLCWTMITLIFAHVSFLLAKSSFWVRRHYSNFLVWAITHTEKRSNKLLILLLKLYIGRINKIIQHRYQKGSVRDIQKMGSIFEESEDEQMRLAGQKIKVNAEKIVLFRVFKRWL